MTNTINVACAAANTLGLPDAIWHLIAIENAIANNRSQIAAADLARQSGSKPIGPRWFNFMCTAPRHRTRECAVRLDPADQRRACPRHLFIPDLVPGEVTDAGEDFVSYRMRDGSAWTNDARKEEAAAC